MVFEAAIIADPQGTVRADRGAIWAAARLGDHFCLAAIPDSGDAALGDFDQDNRSVFHPDRAFGEGEAVSNNFKVHVQRSYHVSAVWPLVTGAASLSGVARGCGL